MTSTVAAPPLEKRPAQSSWPPHWPLIVLTVGFPLWWALGLSRIMPLILAVPMIMQLRNRRDIRLPPGFILWLLFFAWVLLGVLVLWADAPGAVQGGGGPGRLVVFGYRAAWYAAHTVILVWLLNLPTGPSLLRSISRLFAFMFLVTAAGGLLGVAAPLLDFRSPLELVLPQSLAANAFVQSVVHPSVADVQTILGRPEARPTAPFAFSNTWGSNLSLFLPFFLKSWLQDGTKWQRVVAPFVLGLATIPVIHSLNRGLWVSLLLGGVAVLCLRVVRGSRLGAVGVLATAVLAAVIFAASPLQQLVEERLENQHSNERRGQLSAQTLMSVGTGSPLVGFGSTRDVQGNFNSIAGGSDPDCQACGVPPFGTQGHIWLVAFSQGLIGAMLFVGFFLRAGVRAFRMRTEAQVMCAFVLGFFALQLPIYDMLEMPLATVMVAIALMWREELDFKRGLTLQQLWRRFAAGVRPLALLLLSGAVLGLFVARLPQEVYVSRIFVLLGQNPPYYNLDEPGLPIIRRPATIDTEAALALSDATLKRASSGDDWTAVRDAVTVTAPPNTRVMAVEARAAGRPDEAAALARSVAEAFITERRQLVLQTRENALEGLREELARLRLQRVIDGSPALRVPAAAGQLARREAKISAAINEIRLLPVTPGEILRSTVPRKVAPQSDVYVASGAAVGLFAGMILIWASRQRRRHLDRGR